MPYTLSDLHEHIATQVDEENRLLLRRHPEVTRRMVDLYVIQLCDHPEFSERQHQLAVQQRYTARYGRTGKEPGEPKGFILTSIFISVAISVIAHIIAHWIIKWWKEKHQADGLEPEPTEFSVICKAALPMLTPLRQEAEEDLKKA